MTNYAAVVVQLGEIKKHPNADRLAITNIFGNNIILGLDSKQGDIGLYFPLESQLGLDFCVSNDLLRRKDKDGKPAGGMFDPNRRVRAQVLRGEKSMGFYCPMSFLKNTVESKGEIFVEPSVGEEFEVRQGVEICTKYVPVGARHGSGKGPAAPRQKEPSRVLHWNFHFDTMHLGRNAFKIQPDSLISVTWKLHGTSFVVGNTLVRRNLNIFEKALKYFGVKIQETEYALGWSSRKVLKSEKTNNSQGYYSEDIYGIVAKKFEGLLPKGFQVYGEIVGYTPNGSWIQKDYDYGCAVGEHKIYIYRATLTNIDGVTEEIPFGRLRGLVKEWNIGNERNTSNPSHFNLVPEIYYGRAVGFNTSLKEDSTRFGDDFLEVCQKEYVRDQNSIFCKNLVPEEGIIVRVENETGIENYKLKAFSFLNYETKALDAGIVDLETTESNSEL